MMVHDGAAHSIGRCPMGPMSFVRRARPRRHRCTAQNKHIVTQRMWRDREKKRRQMMENCILKLMQTN